MAQAHRNQYLPVGGLVEEDPAWAHRVLLEQAPPQGLLNFAQLSSSRKGWTCLFSELTLAWGKEHAFILPIRTVQEEVCTFALTGQWPFLSSTKPVDESQNLKSVSKVRIRNLRFSRLHEVNVCIFDKMDKTNKRSNRMK